MNEPADKSPVAAKAAPPKPVGRSAAPTPKAEAPAKKARKSPVKRRKPRRKHVEAPIVTYELLAAGKKLRLTLDEAKELHELLGTIVPSDEE